MFAVALYARAWVEILSRGEKVKQKKVALYARAWIEIFGEVGKGVG